MEKLRQKILSANIEEHEKEAKYYDTIHTELFNRYEQKRINKSLDAALNKFDKDSKILDVGCGTGNLTIGLLERGFKNLTSLDISEEMIRELKKKVKKYDCNINFMVSDLDTFLQRNDSKFDIVLISSVLHHLPDYISSLKHLKETLNENGCIYITHEPLPPPKPSILAKLLSRLDFSIYAVRYLILIAFGRLKYLKRDCRYSDYHTGQRAINLLEVKRIFKGNNYKTTISEYSTAKFGFTALLLNRLRFFNNFELIVSKRGNEKS
ncbi:class I SAM-dependent methyltransferase [Chloroflexota bacterium]